MNLTTATLTIVPHSNPRLSKSRIMSGLQCHKRLWLETYHRELMVYDETTHAAFAQGNLFGELARDLIAQSEKQAGHLIASVEDPIQALKDTNDALSADMPLLFEPAFRYEGVFVRIDALIRHDRGEAEPTYTMIEVKAAANVKPQYLRDSAVQIWVLRGIGLNVNRIELGHVNTAFIYNGISYDGLLKRENITNKIDHEISQVQGWIDMQREMLRNPNPPNIEMGRHCNSPYHCPFTAYCIANKPAPASDLKVTSEPEFPIMLLPGVRGKVLARKLHAAGYFDLLTTPTELLAEYAFVQQVYREGVPWHDKIQAQTLLMNQPKPWGYLDFETISPAVPLWAGTSPFAHWPFQWSIHIETSVNGTNENGIDKTHEHYDFLDLSGGNPSIACVEQMLAALAGVNTIWAYNAPFEKQAILRMAKALPDYTDKLHALANKLQDLIPIVQTCYYHPAMLGSYSIKSVLPAIAPELNYHTLIGVQNGNAAQGAFFEAIAPNCTAERRAELDSQLRAYCKLDTWAMVVLVQHLLRQNH